uniref:Uncharacterized protein n=1 Tax=Anguilla anguilla TaxID=7936 RepID=A0A0E9XF86_ANGAN
MHIGPKNSKDRMFPQLAKADTSDSNTYQHSPGQY